MRTGRRLAAAIIGAALMTAPLPRGAWADEAPASFRIAAIIGLSGPLAVIGADMRCGVEVALEERGNTINGVPIDISWDDSEGKPQVTVQKASQRIAQGVQMIFGEIGSPSTIALSGLTEQREMPLLVTFAADNALTTPGRLKWTFRTGRNVMSTVTVTVGFAERNHVKKVFGITPDYDAARSSWDLFKELAKQRGIEIVGEEFHPTPNRDFSILLDKAMRSGADALYSVSQGNDAVTLLKQAAEIGLKDKMKLFGPGIVESTKSWDKKDWIAAMSGNVIEDSIEGRKSMGTCDHQARQIALAGIGVENEGADLPKYGMKVTDVMQPAQIYKPCP